MQGALMVWLAFGATVEVDAGARVRGQSQDDDQRSQLTKQEGDHDTDKAAVDQKLEALQTDITTQSEKVREDAKTQIEPIEIDVQALLERIKTWSTAAVKEATTMAEAANEQFNNMQREATDASNVKDNILNTISSTYESSKDQMEGEIAENLNEIGLNAASTKMESTKNTEEVFAMAEEIMGSMDEGGQELKDDMEEITDEFADAHEEQVDAYKEGIGLLKEIKSDDRAAVTEGSKLISGIRKDADSLPGRIASEARSIVKQLDKSIKGCIKEASKNLKSEKKDALRAVKDEGKEAKSKAKEIKTMFKEMSKETQAQAKDIDAGDYDLMRVAGEDLAAAKSAKTSLQTLASGLEEDAGNLKTETTSKINTAKDNLESAINKQQELINSQRSDMKNRIDQMLEKATNEAKLARAKLTNEAKTTIKAQGSELEKRINDGSGQIEEAGSQLINEAGALIDGIKKNEAALSKNGQDATRVSKSIDDLVESGKEDILKASQAFDAKSVEKSAEVTTAVTESKAVISEAAKLALTTATNAKQNAESMLLAAIKENNQTVADRVENAAQALTTAVQNADVLTQQMETDANAAKEKSTEVHEALPAAKQTAQEAIAAVDEAIAQVMAAYSSARTLLAGEIAREKKTTDDDVYAEYEKMQGTLDKAVQASLNGVTQEEEETQALGADLTKAIRDNDAETRTEQVKAVDLINKGQSELTEFEKTNKAKSGALQTEVKELNRQVSDKTRELDVQGQSLANEVKIKAEQAFNTAKNEAEGAVNKAKTDGAARQLTEVNEAAGSLNTAAEELETNANEQLSQIQDVKTSTESLAKKFYQLHTSSDQVEKEVETEMADLQESQNRVAEDVTNEVSEEEKKLAEEQKAAEDQIAAGTKTAAEANSEELDAVKKTADEEISQAKIAKEMADRKMNQELTGFSAKQKTLLSNVKVVEDQLKDDEKKAKQEADEQRKEVDAAINGLKQTVVLAKDAANEQTNELNKKETAIQDDGLGGQEKLNANVVASKAVVAGAVGVIKREVKEKEAAIEASTDGAINGIKKEMERSANGGPDVVAEFDKNTAEVRTSLGESLARLLGSSKKETEMISGLDHRLAAIRQKREALASKVHGQISAIKDNAGSAAANALDKTVEMKAETNQAAALMNKDLKSFRMQMEGFNDTPDNHDDEEVKRLEDDTFTLTQAQQKLKKWEMQNIFRSREWRKQVLKTLAGLMDSQGMDSEKIKNDQMQEELELHKDLAKMQGRLAEEASKGAVDQAKYFQGMVGNTVGKMGGVLAQAQHLDEQKAAEEHMAAEDVARQQETLHGEVGDVRNNEEALERQAAEFMTQSKITSADVIDAIKLPLLSTTDRAVAIEDKYEQTNNRANLLAPESLIEVGSNLTEDEACASEIQALEELNSELERQNAKLTAQNAKLEKGLASIHSSKRGL